MTSNILYAQDMPNEWMIYQKQRHEHPELFGLKSTGLAMLDTLLEGGIELGQYVLIGGAQKAGKTTLLMKLADSFARQRVNSIFFSAEMNNMQLGSMLFSTYSGIERSRIRKLGLEIADWTRLEIAGEKIEQLTLAFDFGFSTVSDIIDSIEEVEAKVGEPVKAIFGDYIHLMEEPGIKGNMVQEIASISKKLKRLTMSRVAKGNFPIAVIFASQLSREAVKGEVWSATSFYGSGQLERDMDLGMIISAARDETASDRREIPNRRKITIVGSRETPTGECEVAYNPNTATISDAVALKATLRSRVWE